MADQLETNKSAITLSFHLVKDFYPEKVMGNQDIEKIQNIFTEVSRSLGLHTDVRMTWTLEFYANVDVMARNAYLFFKPLCQYFQPKMIFLHSIGQF